MINLTYKMKVLSSISGSHTIVLSKKRITSMHACAHEILNQ